MDCQIRNSLVVGAITSVTGTIVMYITNKDIFYIYLIFLILNNSLEESLIYITTIENFF